MATITTYTVVAHEAMTDNMKTFAVKALSHVEISSVEHIARMAAADKGLVFDALFPVVSLA